MPIRIDTGSNGWKQLSASFRKNWRHYLQETLGLGIFMISACFFGAMLFSPQSPWFHVAGNALNRNMIMGGAMGLTALFIFYSPWTAPSGAQINPAVTLTFLRLNKMCRYDAFFYILFQIAGGLLAVYLMRWLMGSLLIAPPVNSVATVPGKTGGGAAMLVEFLIAFITMGMVLFTADHQKLKKYTRLISGCLVAAWVILAGPVSGFGMNPARSLASAVPAGLWTDFWIYLFIPVAGMFSAAACFRRAQRQKASAHHREPHPAPVRKKFLEPFEFVL